MNWYKQAQGNTPDIQWAPTKPSASADKGFTRKLKQNRQVNMLDKWGVLDLDPTLSQLKDIMRYNRGFGDIPTDETTYNSIMSAVAKTMQQMQNHDMRTPQMVKQKWAQLEQDRKKSSLPVETPAIQTKKPQRMPIPHFYNRYMNSGPATSSLMPKKAQQLVTALNQQQKRLV